MLLAIIPSLQGEGAPTFTAITTTVTCHHCKSLLFAAINSRQEFKEYYKLLTELVTSLVSSIFRVYSYYTIHSACHYHCTSATATISYKNCNYIHLAIEFNYITLLQILKSNKWFLILTIIISNIRYFIHFSNSCCWGIL